MKLIYVAVHKMSRNYFAAHHDLLTWINGSHAWLPGIAGAGTARCHPAETRSALRLA
jgi:hypothetical protein